MDGASADRLGGVATNRAARLDSCVSRGAQRSGRKDCLPRQEYSREINFAFDAYEKIGEQRWGDIQPLIRVGASIAKPLPADQEGLGKLITSVLDLGMRIDVTLLDAAPRLDTAFGELPSGESSLNMRLAELHDHKTKKADQLLAACAQLLEYFKPMRIMWELRCASVWDTMQQVELLANDFYSYLVSNRETVNKERERYFYPRAQGAYLAPRLSDDFYGIRKAVGIVNAAA